MLFTIRRGSQVSFIIPGARGKDLHPRSSCQRVEECSSARRAKSGNCCLAAEQGFTLIKSTQASRCQGVPILCLSDYIFKNCKTKPTPQ